MGEHGSGGMDIAAHEKTFDGFVRMVARAVVVILALLIFLALVNA
jgi:hypothetical protein